jgi:hypothetical protein
VRRISADWTRETVAICLVDLHAEHSTIRRFRATFDEETPIRVESGGKLIRTLWMIARAG